MAESTKTDNCLRSGTGDHSGQEKRFPERVDRSQRHFSCFTIVSSDLHDRIRQDVTMGRQIKPCITRIHWDTTLEIYPFLEFETLNDGLVDMVRQAGTFLAPFDLEIIR
jgi:hypothetical protein